jgi:hypothetical protein
VNLHLRKVSLVFLCGLVIIGLTLTAVTRVNAAEYLVWTGDVYSSGSPVTSAVLDLGKAYRIVVQQIWFYDNLSNLAADAEYYTDNSGDSWDWYTHFRFDSRSFLQINGNDVDWGPFSNGDTGHMYSIYYNGQGAAITFTIVDWIDQNYTNNFCHLHLEIYEETTVGGRVVDQNPSDTTRLLAVTALLLVSAAMVPIIIHTKKT